MQRTFSEVPRLWKGVQHVVLLSSILIRRVDCRSDEFGRSGRGRDPEFMDPDIERGCLAGCPLDDATHHAGILTYQIRHGDSQARGTHDI